MFQPEVSVNHTETPLMPNAFQQLQTELWACRRCQEAGHHVVAPPIFSGPQSARLMIIGQAPGRMENEQAQRPFSGPAGKRLFRWLAEAGWEEAEFRAVHYITAVTKCFPGNNVNGRGDRLPSKAEQTLCRPWLEAELALVQPAVVVPVGGLAISLLLGSGQRLDHLIGRVFQRPRDDGALTPWAQSHLALNTRIVPLPHPSGAAQWLNKPANQELLRQALQHLQTTADR